MEQKLPLVIFKKFCWTLFCQSRNVSYFNCMKTL